MTSAAYDLNGLEGLGGLENRDRWEPKEWRIEYERIVALSSTGISNTEIGQRVGYTKEFVSLVLNLPQAVELKQKILARFHEQVMVDIPTKLSELAVQATKRLETVLMDDELFEKAPFQVVDRGLDVLKGLKHLRTGTDTSTNIDKAVIIAGDKLDNLFDGLTKANEVRLIHAPATNGDA
jgi:hypothetical protein